MRGSRFFSRFESVPPPGGYNPKNWAARQWSSRFCSPWGDFRGRWLCWRFSLSQSILLASWNIKSTNSLHTNLTSRNFYNLLESWWFLWPFSQSAAWNDGILECWPPARRATPSGAYASERRLGLKSGKRSILQKMLYLHFIMISVNYPFSTFVPENTPL